MIRDKKEIYSSFHYPEFTKTNALRNILTRYNEFRIDDLSQKTVFDFGSNIGSLSFEALRRNAKHVKGFEYCKERVDICNQLSSVLDVGGEFHEYDLNQENNMNHKLFIEKYGMADIVFCCAIDAYINNRIKLYEFISKITNEICYFETNSNIPKKSFIEIMKDNGFDIILELGTSKSDAGYGRCSYILIKNVKKIETHNDGEYLKDIYYDDKKYYYVYQNMKNYEKIKKCYEKMKHIEYVQRMEFYNGIIVSPKYENCIYYNKFTNEEKQEIKIQLIDFIRQINSCKICHRDLHTKNAFFHNSKLIIIDWEFVEFNFCILKDAYDLTGTGLISPVYTHNMNIFDKTEYSFASFIGDLTLEEFL
jgi:hypothetical protein